MRNVDLRLGLTAPAGPEHPSTRAEGFIQPRSDWALILAAPRALGKVVCDWFKLIERNKNTAKCDKPSDGSTETNRPGMRVRPLSPQPCRYPTSQSMKIDSTHVYTRLSWCHFRQAIPAATMTTQAPFTRGYQCLGRDQEADRIADRDPTPRLLAKHCMSHHDDCHPRQTIDRNRYPLRLLHCNIKKIGILHLITDSAL